jgi:hypothetical protein
LSVFFGKKTVLPPDAPAYLQDMLAELETLQRTAQSLQTATNATHTVNRYQQADIPPADGGEVLALVTDGPGGVLTLAGSDGAGWVWLTGASAGTAV